jgi:hypothetical protein
MGSIKPQKKRQGFRVALIQLHTIKPLNNKNQLNGGNHHIPINIKTECQWTQLPHQKTFANWIEKDDWTISCLQDCLFLIDRNKHWLRVKRWKIYQANVPRTQAGVAILISDKVDFKLILAKQNKEGPFILIKGAIHQKEITIVTQLGAPNLGAPNFIKHTLKDLRVDIDSNTVVVGDFNTSLSPTDGSSRQKNQQGIPRTK